MNYSITKNGECAKHLCVIDEGNQTVSTQESGLVLDFSGVHRWSFKTGGDCTFDTGGDCTFDTGGGCTFKTSSGCTFKTGGGCTFDTGSDCTFKTGYGCTFNTGGNCTFNTGGNCTFNTGYGCTFNTGIKCVVVDRSRCVLHPFVAPENVDFKTDNSERGYILVNQKKKITIELTDEQFESLKKQGIIT